MARLTLTLLGGFEARLDESRALRLSIKKGQALLAYLAMPAGKPHLRDKLATLLWGDLPNCRRARGCVRPCSRWGVCSARRIRWRLDGEAV
jgi:DNA-binding SARP family transcriptional activator